MRYFFVFACFFLPYLSQAQFAPSEKGLTIIVTDGTDAGKKSEIQPPSDLAFTDEIKPLGMTDAIQAAAFIERPKYGLAGFILVFCVNDAIGDQQGRLIIDSVEYKGVFRLIRQKLSADEVIPMGMTPYRLSGMVYFLGIS